MAIVQAKILDAILHCGGIATTQEIKKLTGLGRTNIWMACTHLVSRYMITKDIKINGKIIYNSKSIGIEKKQIEILIKSNIKRVTVKEGFAFAPAFLIGVIISLILKEIVLFWMMG